jgi:hypothetical protein
VTAIREETDAVAIETRVEVTGGGGWPMLRAIGLQIDVKSVLAGGHSVA